MPGSSRLDRRTAFGFWAGIYAIMLARFFCLGFEYYTVAGDSKYGVYYRGSVNIWNNIVLKYTGFTKRPLAFFTDAYFTMRFWNQMTVMVVLFSALYFLSCFFLSRALQRSGLNVGIWIFGVLALSPHAGEAVYVVSLASLYVPGVFFAVTGVYLFTVFVDNLIAGRASAGRYLSGFWLCNLLSMGYHEQIAVFSFILSIGFIIAHYKRLPTFSRIYSFCIVVFDALVFGLYYFFMGTRPDFLSTGLGGVSYDLSGIDYIDGVLGYTAFVLTACFCGYVCFFMLKRGLRAGESDSQHRTWYRFYVKNRKIDLSLINAFLAPLLIMAFFILGVAMTGNIKEAHETDEYVAESFMRAFLSSDFERKDLAVQNEQIFLLISDSGADCVGSDSLFMDKLNASNKTYFFQNITIVRPGEPFNADKLINGLIFNLNGVNVRRVSLDGDNLYDTETGASAGYVLDGVFHLEIINPL